MDYNDLVFIIGEMYLNQRRLENELEKARDRAEQLERELAERAENDRNS